MRPALTSRAAILALVLCAVTLSLAYPLREYIAQRSEIAQLQETRAHLEDSVADLEQRREDLTSDEHVEQEARTRLYYQYPGENVYVVVDENSEDTGDQVQDGDSAETWFARLWRSVGEADTTDAPVDGIPDAQPLPR
ncbi:FtsB family cell division protein [Spiractinospora alimapuensis]|uniref:FtsB family cell division protein n=1 Tax=Spiractinospora alimapuensis TaxID=2820884 RepID=UPI001F2ED430|nr:septum formation initiator family protein [Spiractinospora alimapuensis]